MANEDYTSGIPHPAGAGSVSADEFWYGPEDIGCECEVDWKCGVCREYGYRHSRLDAFGLGPDVEFA